MNTSTVQQIMDNAVRAEQEILALKAQRDELLAGLERIGRIGGTDGAEDGRLVEYDGAWASVTARALIAKHKGVSHE